MKQLINHFNESIKVKGEILKDPSFQINFNSLTFTCSHALKNKNKLIFFGNGGSAADSQHIAAEFVSKLKLDRAPLAAIALTTDTSILTAIGNDYGFENLFSRQISAIGNAGDIAIGISTSGKSPNVIKALQTAKSLGITTCLLTGNKVKNDEDCADYIVSVPSNNTAIIQEVHIMLGHVLCGVCECEFLNEKP